ncbi:hypothetical protein CR513_53000, partial [Mucuna pruriens]
MGPFPTATTHNGMCYFLTIVAYATRFTWVHLMKSKYQSTQLIKHFFSFVKTQFQIIMQKEFFLVDFLQQKGIKHKFLAPIDCNKMS